MKTKNLIDKKGDWILDNKYQEILTLDRMLTEDGVPHILRRLMDGWQIIYPPNGECVLSAIEHFGSCGNEDDLIEIMGLLTPEERECNCVVGHLTAIDVFERIIEHLEENG